MTNSFINNITMNNAVCSNADENAMMRELINMAIGVDLSMNYDDIRNNCPSIEDLLMRDNRLSHPFHTGYFSNKERNEQKYDINTSNIIIAQFSELTFLGAINQLEKLIGEDTVFRIFYSKEFEDENIHNEQERALVDAYINKANIILDLYKDLHLFEYNFLSSNGKNVSIYKGDISSKMAARIHKKQLSNAIYEIMRELGVKPYWTSQASIIFAEQIANIMFCGYDKISIANIKTKQVSFDKVPVTYLLRPSNKPKITQTSKTIEKLGDICKIWKKALELEGNTDIMSAAKICSNIKPIPMKQIAQGFEKIAKISTVDLMIESYYKGVPIEDII